MKEEILAAVMFFIRFIEKSEKFPQDQIENFKKHLTELLMERFEKHWFPELPSRGQAYRCIRINCASPIDLMLERAASKCGSSYNDLRLPTELTVWVDPSEVCYRLGESEGSYCTLASFPSESRSSSSASSSPTSSPPLTPLQDKYRRMSKQRYSTEFPNKQRNPNMFFSLRMRSSVEGNYNYGSNRQICRGPFPSNPSYYKNINMNRTPFNNTCRA